MFCAAVLGLLGAQSVNASALLSEDADRRVEAPLSVVDIIDTRLPLTPANAISIDPRRPSQSALSSDGADALKTIPGFVALRNGGSNGDPVFRGMSGSRLNILTNGTTLLGACGARMDSPTSYLAPSTFDEISVVKGPQTVLWGPVGSAGTVRFERATERFDKPGMRFHAEFAGGTAGRNEQLADIAVGAASADARLIAHHGHADDYRDGLGGSIPSRWDKWNIDAILGVNIDALTRIELDTGIGDGDARYAGRDMDGARFRRESIALRFRQRDRRGFIDEISAQVYANYANHLMDNFSLRLPSAASGTPMTMPVSRASNVDRLIVGARLAFGMRLAPALHLESGVDVRSDRHRLRKAMAPGSGGADHAAKPWASDARSANVGAFGELTWSATGASRWIAGARLDFTEAQDLRPRNVSASAGDRRDALLPSGFVRYEHDLMAGALTGYVGLGHAARFPDHWERFSASAGPVPQTTAFSSIRPEKTTQIDIGARYEHERSNAWFSAYAGRVQQFILFDFGALAAQATGGGGKSAVGSRVRNVHANVFGGELGVSLPLAARWQAQTSLAYAWGQNLSDGRPLPQMPPLEARLALRYSTGPASVTLSWRVVASQHRIAPQQGNVAGRDFGRSSGFGTVGLNTSCKLSKRFTLSMGVDNLFNKVYAEHLNRAGSAGFGYPANTPFNDPGRTAWASVAIDL